jgi:hypothetical protein
LFNLGDAPGGGGFPGFEGDQKKAFDFIASELGRDPHSPSVDSALLNRIHRPAEVPEAAS